MMRSSAAARPAKVLLGTLLLLAGCASAPPAAQPVLAPAMTIERFLRAANQNDLDTMAALFGTTEGAVKWPKKEADERMFLIASMLRHSDYTIGQEQIVPGRRDEATHFVVRMVISGNPVQVPFTLVRSKQHWLIEKIDTESAMRRGVR